MTDISPAECFERLLDLPQCVAVDPSSGYEQALINLINGMVVLKPGRPAGLSMWSTARPRVPGLENALVVTVPAAEAIEGKEVKASGREKLLAGEDLARLLRCWSAQAKMMGLS